MYDISIHRQNPKSAMTISIEGYCNKTKKKPSGNEDGNCRVTLGFTPPLTEGK
jgi:hypothetical protein